MPGKFPMKQVGMVPPKGGMGSTKVVMPMAQNMTAPAMKDLMMPTALTKGMRRPGKDG